MAKPDRGQSKDADKIGNQIVAALTQPEIARLLDGLFKVLTPEMRAKGLAQLQSDTRQTVQQILAPLQSPGFPEISKTSPISHAKLAQAWSELWQTWDEIVWEATEEEGKYLEKEESWEPPYFDSYSFIKDLEAVAAKMQSLLQAAFKRGLAPDRGFAPALLEAEAEISGALPEWIDIVEGFDLEIHLTGCLLNWEWLTALGEGQDAFHFARRIRQWEEQFSHVTLESKTVLAFLKRLSTANQRTILAGLTADKDTPLWKQSLESAYSHWSQFYLYAIKQYSSE